MGSRQPTTQKLAIAPVPAAAARTHLSFVRPAGRPPRVWSSPFASHNGHAPPAPADWHGQSA
eukprot:15331344-Alexandrium_andersonii.AAC.1